MRSMVKIIVRGEFETMLIIMITGGCSFNLHDNPEKIGSHLFYTASRMGIIAR